MKLEKIYGAKINKKIIQNSIFKNFFFEIMYVINSDEYSTFEKISFRFLEGK